MRRLPASLLLALTLSGCATATTDGGADDDSSSSGDSGQSSSGGKFDQTWSKDYGSTTCREWLNEMSQNENFVAAADMLLGAQSVDDEDVGLPEDDLIERFQGGITNVCEVSPGDKITTISVRLYLTERATFKP